ncbi:alpha/beta hydrolase [Sporosalibacterium faouarense]|uniref:alpha/beta hydrolase n=1 Tax=Sporosalibacterium faouarense TaxID=516123 RepID=UPI00192CC445|nr:alpha/beta hydrolase [Sporosalibacterium faouarense]
MQCIDFKFRGSDGKEIYATKYICNAPIGVVQIAHGMTEHRKRYDEFARELCNAGYNVYINDHRGHGETAGSDKELGFFAADNGWDIVLSDMLILTERIKEDYSELPIYLFGHSMGSFLARTYITRYGDQIKGTIICGTGQLNLGLINTVIPLAKLESKIRGNRSKNSAIEKILFMFHNNGIKPKRTKYDWLSRDSKVVDEYINDKYCGFSCTTSFYKDLLNGMKYIADIENYKTIPKDLSMLLISGEKDPVGNIGLGIEKIVENYKALRLKKVDYRIYSECRHEILNELNKEKVYEDVIKWLRTNSQEQAVKIP